MVTYDRRLKPVARALRRNMTKAERILWSRIRRKQLKGFQFYRQKTIGRFIVDFYCPSGRVIVEVDGHQHYEPAGLRKDRIRDRVLSNLGFKVLRFSNAEVIRNSDSVVEEIFDALPENEE